MFGAVEIIWTGTSVNAFLWLVPHMSYNNYTFLQCIATVVTSVGVLWHIPYTDGTEMKGHILFH